MLQDDVKIKEIEQQLQQLLMLRILLLISVAEHAAKIAKFRILFHNFCNCGLFSFIFTSF